jgi:hypothetical protein
MKVIAHQAERMHLPAGFATALGQGFHEQHPILVVFEYWFAPVTTIHHMVNCTGIFYSELPCHAQTLSNTPLICQYQELTRFRWNQMGD